MTSSVLVNILARLAYRLPWDTWELSDDDYNILDRASGEEIVTVAYRNGFNIVKIVENADHMINEHNERNQKKILRELQNLKIFMLSSSEPNQRNQEPENPPATPDDVERRLLCETIDEVVGIDETPALHAQQENINFSWIDENLEERMSRHQGSKQTPAPTFAEKVQSAVAHSPSLNRDQLEAPGLNLNEFQRSDINQITRTDELPEATNEVLADLGIYTTSIGRRIFDKVNGIDTPQLRRSDEPDAMQVEEIGEVPVFVPDDLPASPHFVLPLEHHVDLPPLSSPALVSEVQAPPQASDVPEVRTLRKSLRLSALPPQQVDYPGRPSALEVEAPRRSSAAPGRPTAVVNELERIAKEAAERQKNAPKQRRVQRPKQRPAAAEAANIDEQHKPLKSTKFKPLEPRDIIVPLRFEVRFDYSDYQDDEPSEAEISEPPVEVNLIQEPLAEIIGLDPVPTPRREPSLPRIPTPMLSPARELRASTPLPQQVVLAPRRGTLMVPRTSAASDISQAKRPRIEVSDVDNQNIEIPDLDPIDLVPPEMLMQPSSTPHVTLRKDRRVEATNTNQKQRKVQTIDAHDMEFASWQHKSLSVQPVLGEPERPQENRRSNRSGNDEYDENGNHLFRRVKGKYDTMIEFVGSDGKVKKCSNYSMETLGLYMQIRFVMAQSNAWKMSFEDLYPKISLLKTTIDKKTIERRVMLLSDFKFLKLTLSEDEEQIIDVEIPVVERMDTE